MDKLPQIEGKPDVAAAMVLADESRSMTSTAAELTAVLVVLMTD